MKIDWEAIHRRLSAVHNAITESTAPPPETVAAVLRERAVALAREAKADTLGDAIDVLECELAHERYGFALACIREVYPLQELVMLPGTPDFVLGIVNVRGQILSVIDLRTFFDLPDKGLSDLNKIVILKGGGREFGVLADRIVGTRRLSVAAMQESLPTLTDVRSRYLQGVTCDRLIVLDARKLLNDDTLILNAPSER